MVNNRFPEKNRFIGFERKMNMKTNSCLCFVCKGCKNEGLVCKEEIDLENPCLIVAMVSRLNVVVIKINNEN